MPEVWIPELGTGGSFRARIADAIERDVQRGILRRGRRLPPQRTLATMLGVSIGTITTAYAELERRGIARGYVGRGTYIVSVKAGQIERTSSVSLIDLASYVIPHHAANLRFAEHRGKFTRLVDVHEILSCGPPAGVESLRRASSCWLKQIAGLQAPWQQLVVTLGEQHALTVALQALCRSGETILCEAVTSPGMMGLAAKEGYKLHGVKLDEEGILPRDLDRAIIQTHAKVLYIMSNVQIPTGQTMSDQRRVAVAEVVRKHKVWVVESDDLALFAECRHLVKPALLSSIIPDRCFYTGSLSQSIAPGLGVGFLVCPSEKSVATVESAIRATIISPSTLGGQLFSQWVEDGSAFRVAESTKNEIRQRVGIARDILGNLLTTKRDEGPNLWFPMSLLQAEQAVIQASLLGVAVAPFTNPLVNGSTLSGIGVCLGAAKDVTQLTMGLQRLKIVLLPELSGILDN